MSEAEGWTEQHWDDKLTGRAQFMVEVDDLPVATAAGIPSDEDPLVAELISMWVPPDSRGAGVGDLLVETVLGWAKVQRYQKIQLWVAIRNDPAEKLYMRHGFTRTGAEHAIDPEDPLRREFSMAQSITS